MGDRNGAISFYNQAAVSVNDQSNPQRLKHGYQLFSSACVTDPTWGNAWFQAGNNNSDLEQIPAAIACWRRALQCADLEPLERAKALGNLGWRLHCEGRTDEALPLIEQSLELEPSRLPYNWVNLSTISQIMRDHERMLDAGKRAYDLKPDDALCETSHAFALLFSGRLADGLRHFEARFPYKLPSYQTFPYPKWRGEDDVTVYVDADQGLGDTLSYARFVPLAAKRAKYIHLCVQAGLLRLFQHAFVDLPNVNIVPKPCGFLPADHWSTFVSLPFALGLDDKQIIETPHIQVPKAAPVANWKSPDAKLHIGISWRGSNLNQINNHRSIPLEMFFELYWVHGIQLYSLQCDENNQQMYDKGGLPLIIDLTRYVRDVVDTVTVLRDLDLVITAESALGHICGMVGKECWIPYSKMGKDYRLGTHGENCFWYPKHRIFNQADAGEWGPVFDEIGEALRGRIGKKPKHDRMALAAG